jgi:3-oxosteroid 1-dehydrogenase
MDETFDFVIIGSGGGSLAAALVLRAAGKTVLVLEKTELVGGTTAMSGGVMWIPDNPLMAREGIEDSAERALGYLNAVVGGDSADTPGTSLERRRAYIEEAPKMVEFLLQSGIALRRVPSWPDYCDLPGASEPGRTVTSELFDINRLGSWKSKLRPGFLPLPARLEEAMALPDFKRSWAGKKLLARIIGRTLANRLRGKHLATAGQALQGQMLHAALEAGVEIRLNSAVQQLLCEEDRVTGVLVANDGDGRKIGAGLGVLINAGGFARNQAMRDRYAPGTSTDWSLTAPGDTGEMIEQAMALGAAIAQMDERVGNPVTLPPGSPPGEPVIVHGDMAKPHSIVVDGAGARYMREANSYVEVSRAMLEHSRQAPGGPSWLVVDSQFLENYVLAGTMPGSKKPKAWTEQQFLRRGDTIEALAAACGIDAAGLRATVERFNGFARSGRDEDFQRGDSVYGRWLGDALHHPSPTLGAIEKAPFYAIPVYPGDVSTFGGLVTDSHARVLREDGSVIPGLYATGTSTASVMGRGCPGAGASIGPSFTWGYVAARHATGIEASEPEPG